MAHVEFVRKDLGDEAVRAEGNCRPLGRVEEGRIVTEYDEALDPESLAKASVASDIGFLILGLALLVFGSQALVNSASDIATELGNPRIANMVMLGGLIEATELVTVETVVAQLDEHLSARQRKWLKPNEAALKKGMELAKASFQSAATA